MLPMITTRVRLMQGTPPRSGGEPELDSYVAFGPEIGAHIALGGGNRVSTAEGSWSPTNYRININPCEISTSHMILDLSDDTVYSVEWVSATRRLIPYIIAGLNVT